MGSRETIATEKGALAEAVGPQGTVDFERRRSVSEGIAARTAQKSSSQEQQAEPCERSKFARVPRAAEFTIVEGAHRCRAQLPVAGSHMVQNALLAVAAGRAFGLSIEECAAGLAAAPLTKARLQIKEIGGVQFLDDSYNANPDSMKAALRTLVELDTEGKRIAVLGEMRELGAESERGHREIGETAATLGVEQLITIGDAAKLIAEGARAGGLNKVSSARSTAEAARLLGEIAEPGDLVLIKGSRAARTEEVIEHFGSQNSASVTSP